MILHQPQLNFDPSFRKHKGDPESTAAFRTVDTATDRATILELVRAAGSKGLTLDEACEAMGRTPNQISGRFSELRFCKQIIDSLDRRETRSGRRAKVYVLAAQLRANAICREETNDE